MSSVGKTVRRGSPSSPSMRLMSAWTAAWAICARGWRPVVRRKDSQPASEMSAKPTIERRAAQVVADHRVAVDALDLAYELHDRRALLAQQRAGAVVERRRGDDGAV